MAFQLDTRVCLYGDPRLSDAQVSALRLAAQHGLEKTGTCWSANSWLVHDATVRFLSRHRLVTLCPEEKHVTANAAGRDILAAIDVASAQAGAA